MKSIQIILSLILSVLIMASFAAAISQGQIDYVNIGDTTSEVGHGIIGWSEPWTWGGSYGGGDDGTLRTVLPRSPDCMTDDKTALFTLTANVPADHVQVRHLLGSQNDAYELYVKEGSNWTLLTLDSSADQVCVGNECWYTDTYYFAPQQGVIEFQIIALTTPESWCADWGLNAFSWAKLFDSPAPSVPEFGIMAAGIAVVGAVGAAMLLRKH